MLIQLFTISSCPPVICMGFYAHYEHVPSLFSWLCQLVYIVYEQKKTMLFDTKSFLSVILRLSESERLQAIDVLVCTEARLYLCGIVLTSMVTLGYDIMQVSSKNCKLYCRNPDREELVRYQLSEHDIQLRRPAMRPVLLPRHHNTRLEWCRRHMGF